VIAGLLLHASPRTIVPKEGMELDERVPRPTGQCPQGRTPAGSWSEPVGRSLVAPHSADQVF
jgi:hypothetical protein